MTRYSLAVTLSDRDEIAVYGGPSAYVSICIYDDEGGDPVLVEMPEGAAEYLANELRALLDT